MRHIYKAVFMILLILVMEAIFIIGMQYYILSQSKKGDIQKVYEKEIYAYITDDMKCFPVPIAYQDQIYFEDTYGAARQNGGHDGCDIMDVKNQAGQIPVISATDGVVTNVGWLYLGGYRIGITSTNNIYYYYAHLDSYAAGISTGKEIKAGELLGFMGNTGEGEEGTKGKFDVHLHFAIYIKDENANEDTVNSYPFLLKLDEE